MSKLTKQLRNYAASIIHAASTLECAEARHKELRRRSKILYGSDWFTARDIVKDILNRKIPTEWIDDNFGDH